MLRPLLPALALLAFLAPNAAAAEEKPLSGPEIQKMLSGNTAVGEQKGTPWRQYFDPNGSTTYISGTDDPSPGQWAVREDKFCSLWPPSDSWDCYAMTGEGDRITWIFDGGGDPWPAQVVPGSQLEN